MKFIGLHFLELYGLYGVYAVDEQSTFMRGAPLCGYGVLD